MSLAHHPPSWLRDGDHVEELLSNRARLQLWGHRHSQRARYMDGNVHIYAGAVHPQRNELDWEPRYNIIRIEIEDGEAQATVTLDGRVWNSTGWKVWPGPRRRWFTLSDVQGRSRSRRRTDHRGARRGDPCRGSASTRCPPRFGIWLQFASLPATIVYRPGTQPPGPINFIHQGPAPLRDCPKPSCRA